MAGFLACAIDTNRTDGVCLDIRTIFLAVEDIIGRHMDQREAARSRGLCQAHRTHRVDFKGLDRFAFGAVDGCVGGTIDHRHIAPIVERPLDRGRVGKVQFGSGGGMDGNPVRPATGSKLTADDDDEAMEGVETAEGEDQGPTPVEKTITGEILGEALVLDDH